MRSVLILLSLFLTGIVQAQDTTYFDKNDDVTTNANAVMYSVKTKDADGGYAFAHYWINGQIKVTGRVDAGKRRNGYFTYYTPEGFVEREGKYEKDHHSEEWKYYFRNSKNYRVIEFHYGSNQPYYFEQYDSLTQKKVSEGMFVMKKVLMPDGKTKNVRKETGAWTFYFKGTDKISKTATYVDGKKNGPFKTFAKEWDEVAVGRFENDLVVGEVKSYINNKLFVMRVFKDGNVAERSFYDTATGKRFSWQEYANGKETGKSAFYDSKTGALSCEGYEVDGDQVGEWTYYYKGSDRKKTILTYRDDKPNGPAYIFDSLTGKVVAKGDIENGSRTGKWVNYYAGSDKIMSRVMYREGEYHGPATSYDSASQQMISEGAYLYGKRNGEWKYYYANGKLRAEEDYRSGQLHGVVNNYMPDGFKYETIDFVKGKRDGEWRIYYTDVKKQWVNAKTKNDLLDGTLETYYPGGSLRRREEYENDKLRSGKCFDETGKEIAYYPFVVEPEFFLENYIHNSIRYPQEALEKRTEGEVWVRVNMDAAGKVYQVDVLKGIGNGCDEEVVRVISNMPPWRPMYIDGIPMRSYKIIPVLFTLPETSKTVLPVNTNESE